MTFGYRLWLDGWEELALSRERFCSDFDALLFNILNMPGVQDVAAEASSHKTDNFLIGPMGRKCRERRVILSIRPKVRFHRGPNSDDLARFLLS